MTRVRHTLMVTDIFGATDGIKSLRRQLSLQGNMVSIIEPYKGKNIPKAQEADTYRYFLNECGHEQYLAHVNHALTSALKLADQDIYIIGFSAGASAVWRALDSNHPLFNIDQHSHAIKHFMGFYPTQIRHHLALSSICKSSIIFPKSEDHFNVKDIIRHLSSNYHTRCIQTPFNHGFMNPTSKHYQHNACVDFENALLKSNTQTTNASDWQFLEDAKRLSIHYSSDTSA